MSNRQYEKIFISNRKLLLIIGTVVVTLFVNLNAAVTLFTAVLYIANKWLWKSNPIRDLQLHIETKSMESEDIPID
jgi:hypothetical protein